MLRKKKRSANLKMAVMAKPKTNKQKTKSQHVAGSQKPKLSLLKENPLLRYIEGKEVYVALILITTVAFFVYKDFLLCNKVMLYKDIGSDTLNGLYPIFR